jgi:hypothetical protein
MLVFESKVGSESGVSREEEEEEEEKEEEKEELVARKGGAAERETSPATRTTDLEGSLLHASLRIRPSSALV